MATVAEFSVDADVFPLGTIFNDLPGVRVELERVVPTEETIIPYFWVEGADVDDIASHFLEHPGVQDVRAVDSFQSQYLMRCEWVTEYAGILTGLAESEVALLSAVGTTGEWQFEVRGDTRATIRSFRQYCVENDISIRVTALHALAPPEKDLQVTEAQEEALCLAYDRGYYDSPRETTLATLGAELSISQQALGDRLRRGTKRLIAGTLADS